MARGLPFISAVDDPALIKAVCAISPGISGAPPCILALCTDERLALTKGGALARDQLAVMDLSMAAQTIMLFATEYGLGSCAVKSFQAVLVHRLLGLPPHIAVHLLLTLGYPAKIPENAPRRRPHRGNSALQQMGGINPCARNGTLFWRL
jgi:nitroreductase